MQPIFFVSHSEKFLNIYHTRENLELLDTVFRIFHQIYLYRLQNIQLDIALYESPNSSVMETWQQHTQMTIFLCYRDIIETVLSHEILRANFDTFNSYEKISWTSCIALIKKQIPDVSSIELYELLEGQEKSDVTALDMRLMADFGLTEEYISYMDHKYRNIPSS